MEIRPATADDSGRIKTLAHDSLRSSYALSPQGIETLLAEEFDDGTVSRRIDDPETTVLVAEAEADEAGGVQGFADLATGSDPTLRWLHVDPDARGQGIGTALVERARAAVDEGGLDAWILEDAAEGSEFLERFGFERDGTDRMDVGPESFDVAVFMAGEGTEHSNEPTVTVPESTTVDGAERPLDHDERIPGRDAPFFVVFSDDRREAQYGYFCSHCGSTDVAADGLDRLECGQCGNRHLAEEWDGSYL